MHKYRLDIVGCVFALAGLGLAGSGFSAFQEFPKGVVNGSANGQYASRADGRGLDSPKVDPINATSYDWWYFDVVSEDQKYVTAITFLASPRDGFAPGGHPPDDMLYAVFSVSEIAADGPGYVLTPRADEAVVMSAGDGAAGFWRGSGMQFVGTADLSSYRVSIDVPSANLTGYVHFKSRAPGHYPSGPARAGESMEILPGIGWANAILDADAEVYYNVNGTSYEFKGAGYHDKNWGTATFMDNLGSWYWGHGRLGPYSLVWYDGTTRTGEEHVSAYVAKDGEILYASNSSLVMRPLGNFTHPPTKGDLPPGFHIQIDMGAEGIMEVDLNSTYRDVAHKAGYYSRWVGTLTGGIRGEEAYTGNGVYEQYAVLD